ncbi:transglutaminase domain-containing protein [Candidatus Woesebacteria bacterium]|nr:transglutaminase domain-containing protein [Candidatus Woesebacteria bacterium]
MTKKTLFFAIFVILTLFLAATAYSQEQFAVDVLVEYQVNPGGKTTVTQNVTLENLTSEFYAKSYSLTLENIDPVNPVAWADSKNLQVFEEKNDDTTTLKVGFDEGVVGKGSKRIFTITFEEDNFVTKTGEIWEISVPRLTNIATFRNYAVTLIIPKSFGNEAYLSPDPKNKEVLGNSTKFFFDKESVAKVGISAGFGELQIFSFNLKYHLENPIAQKGQVEIALPPDTAYQKVYYEKIEPQPSNMRLDQDGNWLAAYDLAARARVDVEVYGTVELFSAKRREIRKPDEQVLSANLKATKYWQVDDPQIVSLAQKLKNPKAIYDFVIETLTYDYERVRPNVERLGALGALATPESAICMEFTDLFIAVSRAAGIPAREINGFAYTENPEIEPLSLVADVLHSWPEYWDSDREVWVPIDPTWADTTGGVDFFHQLDLRHFAFVIHGSSDEKPYPAGSYKLGLYPQKDVFVRFGQPLKVITSKPQVLVELKSSLVFLPPKVVVKVMNPGPVAIYNSTQQVYFDDQMVQEVDVDNFLPFSAITSDVAIAFSLLAVNYPKQVRVIFNNENVTIEVSKSQTIITNLIAIVLIIIFIVVIALVRLKKLKLPTHVRS